MAKHVRSLTDSQTEALKQFKKNVADVVDPYDNDAVLLKWLRARNFHLGKAEVFYREFYAMRQVYDIDNMSENYVKPEMVEKYEFTSFLGYAKDGSVIRYNQLGKADHLGFIKSLSGYGCAFYGCSIMGDDLVRQRQHNKETGDDVREITYIMDLEGLCIQDILHKCVLEMGIDFGQMVQDYYPEVWGNVIFINVPIYFDAAFKIFKPILRHTFIQKMIVVSAGSVAETLLKYIDEDVLPVFLGGKRVDSTGDPLCNEFLRFGGKVPEKYFALNAPQLSATDHGVKALWISPRCVFNHPMIVPKPGSRFHIEFRTEGGSINLRVLYRKTEANEESINLPSIDEYLDERDETTNVKLVSPPLGIQAHIAQVNEFCVAPWSGIYIFRFNNSQSWFGSRRLVYRITLIEPDS